VPFNESLLVRLTSKYRFVVATKIKFENDRAAMR
jgi:hypothetical protein